MFVSLFFPHFFLDVNILLEQISLKILKMGNCMQIEMRENYIDESNSIDRIKNPLDNLYLSENQNDN